MPPEDQLKVDDGKRDEVVKKVPQFLARAEQQKYARLKRELIEAREEQELAAGDAKARDSAAAAVVSPDEPASAVLPDNPLETATGPADMVRST